MKNNRIVLMRTLLLSTSQINKLKYVKDKKQKRRIIGNMIGIGIVFLMIMAYSILMCVGYGQIGMTREIPSVLAITISGIAFIFCVLRTNGYLFQFKEYDMLMALPFEPRTIAADKFLYMYVKCLPWYLSISLAMMIGYGIYEEPSFRVYPIWIFLSLLLPIIPMLLASFIGFLIAKVSSGFRKKKYGADDFDLYLYTVLLFPSVYH